MVVKLKFQLFIACRQFNISVPWLVVASVCDNCVVGGFFTNVVVGALVVLLPNLVVAVNDVVLTDVVIIVAETENTNKIYYTSLGKNTEIRHHQFDKLT